MLIDKLSVLGGVWGYERAGGVRERLNNFLTLV